MVKPSLKNSSSSIVLRILYKFFMPSADKIIVSSKAMYDDLFNRKIDKKRLHLIHNPIDHLKLRKVTFFYRHPGKGLRLVAMGRLVYQKGFDRLIPNCTFALTPTPQGALMPLSTILGFILKASQELYS